MEERCVRAVKGIRLGTIGTGVIVHSILDGVKLTEGISLEAVYSRSGEKGRKLADEYGAQKVYTDLEALMEDPEVNFIYVASPNSLHYGQTKMALEHGKNVLCEKPFCTKREQVLELTRMAKERGLFLVEAVPTAFLPNFALLKEQIPKIGRLRLVMCNYSQYSGRYDQVRTGIYPNVFSPDFAGGCLQDINFYNVYLNVALFGKPKQAVYYPNLCGSGVDTSGVMMMQYDGFVSTSAGAKDTWGINYVQIEGEDGYIYVENGSNGIESFRVVTRNSQEIFNAQENPDRWFYEVQAVTKLVQDGDYEAFYRMLQVTADVVQVIEETRKRAGILFSDEK